MMQFNNNQTLNFNTNRPNSNLIGVNPPIAPTLPIIDSVTEDILAKKRMVVKSVKRFPCTSDNIRYSKTIMSLTNKDPQLISNIRSMFADSEHSARGFLSPSQRNIVAQLAKMNILTYQTSLNGETTLKANVQATDFVNNLSYKIFLADYIRSTIHPDIIYYDVSLCDMNNNSNYNISVVYLKNNTLYFVLHSVSMNLMNPDFPNGSKQLEKIIHTVSRLRNHVSIVIPNSEDCSKLASTIKANALRSVDNISVVSFSSLLNS